MGSSTVKYAKYLKEIIQYTPEFSSILISVPRGQYIEIIIQVPLCDSKSILVLMMDSHSLLSSMSLDFILLGSVRSFGHFWRFGSKDSLKIGCSRSNPINFKATLHLHVFTFGFFGKFLWQVALITLINEI